MWVASFFSLLQNIEYQVEWINSWIRWWICFDLKKKFIRFNKKNHSKGIIGDYSVFQSIIYCNIQGLLGYNYGMVSELWTNSLDYESHPKSKLGSFRMYIRNLVASLRKKECMYRINKFLMQFSSQD